MNNKKVVLAYSGGLDTSVAVKWLIDKGYEIIAFGVDLGQGVNKPLLTKRAKAAGASKVYIYDSKEEFINDYIYPALKANAVYENKYPLATALSRPLIAQKLVEIAHKEKAAYVAHGCTGKGNDQVRFEVSIRALDSKLKIIAPIRDWEFVSRDAEIRYAKVHNIPIDVTKKSPYSTDINLWGMSIECGVLEDPNIEPPGDAYQITKDPLKAPNRPTYIDIEFSKGIPIKINGKAMTKVKLLEKLTDIGAANGVGRLDMVENRLVGIKSREIYEAPAAAILLTGHRELEALVLDRELMHFKESVSLKYAELIYYGLWFTELRTSLDKFINETQKKVTGKVRIKLYKGSCVCVGRTSKYALYNKRLATYDDGDMFDHKAAEGFIKLWGLPYQKLDMIGKGG